MIYYDPSGHIGLCPKGLTQPGNNGSSEGGTGVLDNANYAQKTYSNTFSGEGRAIYSDLAGEPINTIDGLVNAIDRTGEALFEALLTGQLSRNKLTSEGISTVDQVEDNNEERNKI